MSELNEKWSVTYQYHTKDEEFFVNTEVVEAENIGLALKIIDDTLSDYFEQCKWSDYNITSICVIPEMH